MAHIIGRFDLHLDAERTLIMKETIQPPRETVLWLA